MYDVLIQKVLRLEKDLVEAKGTIKRLQHDLDVLYIDRESNFRTHQAQSRRVIALIERITMLEDRAFPTMGPMLEQIESVVGELETWHTDNPLDERRIFQP